VLATAAYEQNKAAYKQNAAAYEQVADIQTYVGLSFTSLVLTSLVSLLKDSWTQSHIGTEREKKKRLGS
jgi:hypothetical protein